MSEMSISEASVHLGDVADESAATGKVISDPDERRLAAIVMAAAEAALAEPGDDIPAEEVWAELGIADDE